MLDALKLKYRQVRFNVRFAIADYKQRYYSNSKNSRVIHTKLQNQPLITLRTEPHDKYLHSPGEFLKVPEETENKEQVDFFDSQSNMDAHSVMVPNVIAIENKWNITSMLGKFAALMPVVTKENVEHVKEDGKKEEVLESDALIGVLESQPMAVNVNVSEDHEKLAWKSILNDASLSAARISVGIDVPQLRDSYINLAADLTAAKAICSHSDLQQKTARKLQNEPFNSVLSRKSAYYGILSLYNEVESDMESQK